VSKGLNEKKRNLEIWFCFFVTATAFPFLIEPLQLPKAFVLNIFSIILLYGFLSLNAANVSDIQKKIALFIVLLFLTCLSPSFLNSNMNLYMTLFGSWGRNLGLVTYFCFVIFFISSFLKSHTIDFSKILTTSVYLITFIAIYGLLQKLGIEPLQLFSSAYNPSHNVILTLGNTNFASAFLAMMGILSLGGAFTYGIAKFPRILSCANLLAILILIISMDDLQGKALLGFGFLLFTILNYRQILKSISTFSNKIKFTMGFVFITSMLPLAYFAKVFTQNFTESIVQGSFKDRVYLWGAAMDMIRAHPLTGVGIDNYSSEYRLLRSIESINFRGTANLGSDNAHNLLLHLGSTSGISIMLFVIFIFSLVLVSSMYLYLKLEEKILYSSLFIFTLCYVLQTMISPDNIGLSIWFWTYGGFILGKALKLVIKGENIVKN
jgi:O-antigen ligase